MHVVLLFRKGDSNENAFAEFGVAYSLTRVLSCAALKLNHKAPLEQGHVACQHVTHGDDVRLSMFACGLSHNHSRIQTF